MISNFEGKFFDKEITIPIKNIKHSKWHSLRKDLFLVGNFIPHMPQREIEKKENEYEELTNKFYEIAKNDDYRDYKVLKDLKSKIEKLNQELNVGLLPIYCNVSKVLTLYKG